MGILLKYKKRKRRQRVTVRRSYSIYRWKVLVKAAWLAALWLFVAGVVLSGANMAQTFWRDSSWFKVRSIRVDPAAPRELASHLLIKPGDHLFGFSSRALEERLEGEFPELSRVKVWRTLSGGVRVSVDRRMPEARMRQGGHWMGIDEDGTVFPLREGDADVDVETLPVVAGVTGEDAATLLNFLAALRKTGDSWTRRIRRVRSDASNDVFFYLDDGTPVYWGDIPSDRDLLKKKARRLERVFNDPSLAAGIAYARFVDDRRVAVKPLPARPEGAR